MTGNNFKEKKVVPLIFTQFWSRSHLNKLDQLTPQDVYYTPYTWLIRLTECILTIFEEWIYTKYIFVHLYNYVSLMIFRYIPVIVLKARKFALMFSLGSLFTMGSFSFLWGPCNHLQHLFSKDRLPFTSVYLGTLTATLYFALGLQSYMLTSVAAVGQVIALLWFVISYIPGGQTGMKFFARICSSMCRRGSGNVLPI